MRQAREALGIDQKTLVAWLKRADLVRGPWARSDRRSCPDPERRHGAAARRDASPGTAGGLAGDGWRDAPADRCARGSPATRTGSTRHDEQSRRWNFPAPAPEAPESPLTRAERRPRKRASGNVLDLEQLPEAWIAYNTGFCKAHGNLDPRSLERDGFPQPHDRGEQRADWWRSRGKHPQGIRRAYDLEQHLEAARMAAKRWPEKFTPCEVCGKAREPTSTNPLATYFSDHV